MKFSILPLLIAVGSAAGRGDGDDSSISIVSSRQLQGASAGNVTASPTLMPSDLAGNQTTPDTDPPTPTPWLVRPKPLPANFKLTASFDASNEDSTYFYTLAVAGQDASITSHTGSDQPDENDPVVYFKTFHSFNECDLTVTEPISFMTFKAQLLNHTALPSIEMESKKICWKAPVGNYINTGSGNPIVHQWIFQLLIVLMKHPSNWEYDGQIATRQGEADTWIVNNSREGSIDTVYLSRFTGEILKYTTRLTAGRDTQEITLEVLEYSDKPNEIPNASLTNEEKESCTFLSSHNIVPRNDPSRKRCDNCQEEEDVESLANALKGAYLEAVSSPEKGLTNTETDLISLVSTERDYEMKGSEEEQAMVNGLKSFQPEMVGRKRLHIRNQSNCGSCYSFAAAHTITSSYSQENPDSEIGLFSNQHLMNCFPVNAEGNITDTAGCWGMFPAYIIDMLVHHDEGKLPLLDTEPYLGIQSHCDLEQEMVQTGITGRSAITTVEQMKNALYFRGDVAVAVDGNVVGFVSEDASIIFPEEDIDLNDQADLGEGVSSVPPAQLDHAVVIIGWGPCQVTHCKTGESVSDECWILQNSYGTGKGWNGYFFIHTDLDCDIGIVSSGQATIPLFGQVNSTDADTVTSSVNDKETSGGTIKTYPYFLFAAAATVALF